jgi:hypothetical protein
MPRKLGLVISNGQNTTPIYYSNLAQNISAKPRPTAAPFGGQRFGSMIGSIYVQKQGCGCGKKM